MIKHFLKKYFCNESQNIFLKTVPIIIKQNQILNEKIKLNLLRTLILYKK